MRTWDLFTIVSAMALFAAQSVAAPIPERKHHKRRPEDLIPSDHGVELNRDFTNMI